MSSYTTTSSENSHFSKWTPFIGVYIVVATLISVIAVVVDLAEGLRRRQYWIPSTRSALNAASITVIAAASKLSLDLSTSMPQQIDQLSKLSTSAFGCIALAVTAPSIGKLENSEFLSNIAALSVFVISLIVGVCIQLRTGVIFTFQTAHIAMIVTMGILLVKCVVSTTTLSLFKSYFKVKYDTRHQKALKDVKDRKHPTTEKLKQYLERFSMMAHSGCPHFLMARLVPGAIHTVCGLVAAMAFFTILIACIIHKDKFLGPTSQSGTSNYGWSVLFVLISQTIGVGVGTIVLCIRGTYIIAVQSRKAGSTSLRKQKTITPEKYWMQGSEELKWFPLLPFIEYRQQKWLGYLLKYPFYMTCFFFQLISPLVDITLFWLIPYLFCKCIIRVMPSRPHHDDPGLKELKPYFLPSDVEFDEMEMMMKSILYVSKRCLAAEERETKHLRELLRDYCSDGFEGVVKFQIPPSRDSPESPPNCWSLSMLTLTWIATVLPNTDHNSMDKLRKSVMEGLVYVKLIEDNFNNKHELTNFRTVTFFLWRALVCMDKISFFLRWVPLDLKKFLLQNRTAKQTLQFIRDRALMFFTALTSKTVILEGFPCIAVGAHYVYGTCEMILLDCSNDPDDPCLIFDKLSSTIADILGACLINLKLYILLESEQSSSIEKRREAACQILKLFGETEKIMGILETRRIPDILPEEMVQMDNWRLSHNHHQADELL